MALSLGSNTYNRVAREDAEFPILCQVCLGDNPYLRMMKDRNGAECKICLRPFTTFRWCPGRGMRYKKTEICQTCCKIKNVCQTCLLDMEFGLPVQVRDAAIQLKDELPKSGVNRDFYIQNVELELSKTDATGPSGDLATVPRSSEMLAKLARSTPYYRRNLPHICSFWVKGECKRGEECPYRHEKPTDPDDPLSEQNIKDRYYGVNDPVAQKLLSRAETMPALVAPADSAITTLYIGNLGLDGEIVEKDLQDYFYQFGEIRAINILPSKGCAFVQFTTRSSAEMAAEKAFNKLIVKGRRLTVRWGKPQSITPVAGVGLEGSSTSGRQLLPVPGLPGALPMPPMDFFGLSQPGLQATSPPKLPGVTINPPVAEPYEPLLNEGNDEEEEGGSEAKRPKMDPSSSRSTLPGLPQGYPLWGTKQATAPNVKFSQAGPSQTTLASAPPPPPQSLPGRPIYYPSQDPLRLGARQQQQE